MQAKVPSTSLSLWQQYSSDAIAAADLSTIKAWATAMRPRSIHDLKPMLMLCQALLRDVSGVCESEVATARAEEAAVAAAHLAEVQRRHTAETQVCATAGSW